MRLREPRNIRRMRVAAGSRADGRTVREVMIGHGSWIERIGREGSDLPVHGGTQLRAGDDVWLISDADDVGVLGALFRPETQS
jgi:Trk K+ transport system NAD-binding subunit